MIHTAHAMYDASALGACVHGNGAAAAFGGSRTVVVDVIHDVCCMYHALYVIYAAWYSYSTLRIIQFFCIVLMHIFEYILYIDFNIFKIYSKYI